MVSMVENFKPGVVKVDLNNFSGISKDYGDYSIHKGGQALGFNAPIDAEQYESIRIKKIISYDPQSVDEAIASRSEEESESCSEFVDEQSL